MYGQGLRDLATVASPIAASSNAVLLETARDSRALPGLNPQRSPPQMTSPGPSEAAIAMMILGTTCKKYHEQKCNKTEGVATINGQNTSKS